MKIRFELLGSSKKTYILSDLSVKELNRVLERLGASKNADKFYRCDPVNIAACLSLITAIEDINIFKGSSLGIFVYTDDGVSKKQNEYLNNIELGLNNSMDFRQTSSNLISTLLSVALEDRGFTITSYLFNNHVECMLFSLLHSISYKNQMALIMYVIHDKRAASIDILTFVYGFDNNTVSSSFFEYLDEVIVQPENVFDCREFLNHIHARKNSLSFCHSGILKVYF